jgi:hypothetical protein
MEAAPADMEAAPADTEAALADMEAALADMEAALADIEAALADIEAAPADMEAAPADMEAAPAASVPRPSRASEPGAGTAITQTRASVRPIEEFQPYPLTDKLMPSSLMPVACEEVKPESRRACRSTHEAALPDQRLARLAPPTRATPTRFAPEAPRAREDVVPAG